MRRLLSVVLAALALAPAAYAATFNFSVTTTSPVTVAGVTLNGDDQTKTFTIVSSVQYTGGQNTAGWKVQASATTPTAGTNTLPALQVTAGSFTCASSCTTNPDNPIGASYPITMTGTAATIYNASANKGQGTFNVTSTFQETFPANIFPGTYASTVTLVGSTGP